MAGYPYHSRWTDNRRRRSSGVRAFDAQQSKPYGMIETVRPVVVIGGESGIIPITAYNVVKSDDPDAVFAATRGPLETGDPGEGDLLFCKLSPFTRLNDPFSILISIPNIRLYMRRDDPADDMDVSVQFAFVGNDWDPTTLTYNTAAIPTMTGGVVTGQWPVDVALSEKTIQDEDTLGYDDVRVLNSMTHFTVATTAGMTPSTTVIKAAAFDTFLGGKLKMIEGDNDGQARTIVAVDTISNEYTVDPPFEANVLENESLELYALITGLVIGISANGDQFGRLEEVTDGITLEKVYF